ncbi:uncharacterized protein LOC117169082 isoform X2 [Belonocnema kinseyi]|uniref:uncharacterized protein LOC117169082 isoform X2 n=1 Tax=Belonocnema kinseyi TaxID=2817044 RepID=UPI00143D169D|nr:uncharacterized protein LOC117169082 isoform X2 [Belonocnema kinseyi]
MATESFAYLQKVITDPETTIVQEQIKGNVAKMLIILPDGDQKMIVFDIPLENCTVLNLLQQASVPHNSDTVISLVHDPSKFGINYIVEIQGTESGEQIAASDIGIPLAEDGNSSTSQVEEVVYKVGELAVCPHCGFLSSTFHRCQRCKRKLSEGVKSVPDNYYVKETAEIALPCENSDEESSAPSPKMRKLDIEIAEFSEATQYEECQFSSETNNLVEEESHHNLVDCFEESLHIKLTCRTVRIGSYKYVPPEDVMISEYGLRLIVPTLEDEKKFVKVDVMYEDIVRVLIHFGRHLPVLFFFTSTRAGQNIRNAVGMVDPSGLYYDPASQDRTHKRITLLPNTISDDAKKLLKNWFESKLEELSLSEANDILVRATPKLPAGNRRTRRPFVQGQGHLYNAGIKKF